MGYSYRCTKGWGAPCRQRYTFAKPLEEYQRTPKGLVKIDGTLRCGECRKGRLAADDHNIKQWNRAQGVCSCDGLPYPHRKGTTVAELGNCIHAPEPPSDPWGMGETITADDGEVPF